MPFYVFQKPKHTNAWTLKGSFTDYGAARTARDKLTQASTGIIVRMVTAKTESEARGKNGSAWNAITHNFSS